MGNVAIDPVHGTQCEFEPRGDDLYVETTMRDGGELPKHFHPKQTEVWWVIDGEMEIYFDGAWRTVTAADGKLDVTPGMVHGLRNRSGSEARLGTDVIPALHLEEFLTEAAQAARDGLFTKGGIPRNIRGARWAAGFLDKHEDETVMVFPPRFLQKLMKPLAPRS